MFLAEYGEKLTTVLLGYLKYICEDEIVGVEGRENTLASTFSVLSVVVAAWQDGLTLMETGGYTH